MWKKLGRVFDKRHAQVPVVEDMKEFWRIFHSDRVGGKSVPKYIDVSKKDFSVINEYDGPIVPLGERGTFDWAGVMPTSVIKIDEKTTYIYYVGWSNRIDVPYHNNLGLIITEDGGKTYRKISTGPIFSTSRLEPGYIGTCYVLKSDNVFMGWYLSCRNWIENEPGIFDPIYDMRLALSYDGIDWTPTGDVCIPLADDEGGISQASVLRSSNEKYEMWFSSRKKSFFREKSGSYRIKYATSIDGKIWTRENDFCLEPSPTGWDDIMVEYPCVVLHDCEKLMFYNGNGFGATGIGVAKWE